MEKYVKICSDYCSQWDLCNSSSKAKTHAGNFFSLEKFEEDCDCERKNLSLFKDASKNKGIIPLYLPTDESSMVGIREIAEKGGPKNAEHTLQNVDSFLKWEQKINAVARGKLYFPHINDTEIDMINRGKQIVCYRCDFYTESVSNSVGLVLSQMADLYGASD